MLAAFSHSSLGAIDAAAAAGPVAAGLLGLLGYLLLTGRGAEGLADHGGHRTRAQ